MMFSYPYFKPPYYHRYSRYGYYYPNSSYYYNNAINNSNHSEQAKKHNTETVHTKKIQRPQPKKEEPSSKNEDSPLFQIFGIDLYYDDILLVCLIFFLYQEGVKDEGLFIALILLLLS